MEEDRSEEFRKFVLENRDIIESILNEGKEEEEEPSLSEKIDQKKEESKDKVKSMNDAVLKIISDDDVQKHFITGCLEFLHFVEAVISAAPLSPEAREAFDKFEETKDTTVRNIVVVGAKDKMENITINDVKTKTAKKTNSTIEKIENISIRDIKDSINERKTKKG